MLTRRISEAPVIWNHLNGIINVYKPAGTSMLAVQKKIAANLCRDLNNMEVRPPRELVRIEEINTGTNYEHYLVKSEPSWADNTLVVGERYQPVDISSICSCHLGKFTSGVMVLGINGAKKTAFKIRDNRPIKVYHVTGRFGRATESHFNDSPVTLRASFDHISLNKMNSYLASMESSHQKKMFDLCGVDIQTQAGFDLAVQGPLRPTVTNIPLLYSIRCIEYKKPYFTLEIHAVNESEAYLGILVHETGIDLRSVAYCTQIRSIRQSHFTLKDSLVQRHWNLQNIVNNMARCNEIIQKNPEMLKQIEATLQEKEEIN